MKQIKKTYYTAGVSMTLGMFASTSAMATPYTATTVSNNILSAITDLPNLISAVAYLAGTVFGVLGVLKIKEHVENPQTPLKEGAIKLGTAGALFVLPFMFEVMADSIQGNNATVTAPAYQTLGSIGAP